MDFLLRITFNQLQLHILIDREDNISPSHLVRYFYSQCSETKVLVFSFIIITMLLLLPVHRLISSNEQQDQRRRRDDDED